MCVIFVCFHFTLYTTNLLNNYDIISLVLCVYVKHFEICKFQLFFKNKPLKGTIALSHMQGRNMSVPPAHHLHIIFMPSAFQIFQVCVCCHLFEVSFMLQRVTDVEFPQTECTAYNCVHHFLFMKMSGLTIISQVLVMTALSIQIKQ